MRTLLLRCLCVALCLMGNVSARADVWTFRADSFCPYNCEPGSSHPGYMVEILQRAATAHGHTLDYKLLPWPRALQQARDGTITGVLAMTVNDREGLWMSAPMGEESNCLFVRPDSALRYTHPRDLDRFGRIGTVEAYGYPPEFEHWMGLHPERIQALAGENTLAMQAQKLAAGHIDAFVENMNVVRYAQAQAQLPALQQARSAGCLRKVSLYIGYSRQLAHARDLQAQVNQTLAAMKKSGELRRLLDKYRVAPW